MAIEQNTMNENVITLADLREGETALIRRIQAEGPTRHRLFDFGFRAGVEVTMVKSAPLADPVEFKIRGGYVSLRRLDASQVEVEKVIRH